MRIIRQVAPNTRQAMRLVRERLGDNAVILSSRRIPEGVEITAGADVAGGTVVPEIAAEAVTPASVPGPAPVAAAPATAAVAVRQAPAATTAEATVPEAAAPATSDTVGQELKTLRCMLETQLATLAWTDLTRRLPVHTQLLRELSEMGIARDLAERISAQLPQDCDLTYGRRFAFTALAQYLPVTGERWAEQGGRLALIGATGVGKTTTLAKLAVRWTLRHGARELALVASDSARMGAHDELRALGQLLGAAVYVPERFADVPELVGRLDRYRMILIDTPGANLRDPKFAANLSVLAGSASQLESVLVLSASTQAGALEEVVRRFEPAHPATALLTKLDEATSLGGSLSVLIRAQLRLSYISEGQRVPEDLRPARALDLVSRAVALAKENATHADEDLLRRRFGKVSHVSA
ncbi:MAG TPA: flagellar biosynthesis protein FlhF [Steroidobacteraceae bacterium]|nr:flagellar biosynthesis protein FlhF [Steroidobacteraceae bacterium]